MTTPTGRGRNSVSWERAHEAREGAEEAPVADRDRRRSSPALLGLISALRLSQCWRTVAQPALLAGPGVPGTSKRLARASVFFQGQWKPLSRKVKFIRREDLRRLAADTFLQLDAPAVRSRWLRASAPPGWDLCSEAYCFVTLQFRVALSKR